MAWATRCVVTTRCAWVAHRKDCRPLDHRERRGHGTLQVEQVIAARRALAFHQQHITFEPKAPLAGNPPGRIEQAIEALFALGGAEAFDEGLQLCALLLPDRQCALAQA